MFWGEFDGEYRSYMAKKLDPLIFVDTNILLDFYRIQKSEINISYLNELESIKNVLIIGSQVEMEYKKNRQKVILSSLKEFKDPNWSPPPAIVQSLQASKMLNKHRGEMAKQKKLLDDKIQKILKNPSSNDIVFQSLQRIFKHKYKLNLNRESDERFEIRELAQKRFTLGYPPRKDSDNSIGDAINWEWIIRCASREKKDVIIVSRDTDYGCSHGGESFINDWLAKEFKERVSSQKKVILTQKLSWALREISKNVSEEMEKEEDRIIKAHEDNQYIEDLLE